MLKGNHMLCWIGNVTTVFLQKVFIESLKHKASGLGLGFLEKPMSASAAWKQEFPQCCGVMRGQLRPRVNLNLADLRQNGWRAAKPPCFCSAVGTMAFRRAGSSKQPEAIIKLANSRAACKPMAPILAYLMHKCVQSALRLVRRRVMQKDQQTLGLPGLRVGYSCPDLLLQQLLGKEAGEGIRTLRGTYAPPTLFLITSSLLDAFSLSGL